MNTPMARRSFAPAALAAAVLFGSGCREAVKPDRSSASAADAPATAAPSGKLGTLPVLPPVMFGEPITFVVMGDNRGDSEGVQRPVFEQMLQKINEVSPRFVFTTGDMVAGYTEDEAQQRRQWEGYRKAIGVLTMPIFHSPGNHDLHDAMSARMYKELWGPTYYAVDFGCARLIALDTESDPGRIGPGQFAWLEGQLSSTLDRRIFLFFHQPLYPVDGHIGSSQDVHPEDRDKLHALFVAHRDRIAAVFAGHEHLYSFEERDGVKYYITGGAGANLYAPREQGGFFHFLTVRVSPAELTIDVVKVGPEEAPPAATRVIKSGEALETWENRLAWDAWDETVGLSSSRANASSGKRSLKMTFDFAKCQWPLVYTGFKPALDLTGATAVVVDVFVPDGLAGALTVAPQAPGKKRREKFAAPAVALKPGWNTVRADLSGTAWLSAEARAEVKGLEWILATETKSLAGWVAFDHLRLEGAAPRDLEDWEGMLSWNTWNLTVEQAATAETVKDGTSAVRLTYDLAKWARPALFARLPERWDLSKVPAVTVDAFVPPGVALPLGLSFVVTGAAKQVSPPVALKAGWNAVRVPLRKAWLPAADRAGALEIEWQLSGEGKGAGWIALDRFKAQ